MGAAGSDVTVVPSRASEGTAGKTRSPRSSSTSEFRAFLPGRTTFRRRCRSAVASRETRPTIWRTEVAGFAARSGSTSKVDPPPDLCDRGCRTRDPTDAIEVYRRFASPRSGSATGRVRRSWYFSPTATMPRVLEALRLPDSCTADEIARVDRSGPQDVSETEWLEDVPRLGPKTCWLRRIRRTGRTDAMMSKTAQPHHRPESRKPTATSASCSRRHRLEGISPRSCKCGANDPIPRMIYLDGSLYPRCLPRSPTNTSRNGSGSCSSKWSWSRTSTSPAFSPAQTTFRRRAKRGGVEGDQTYYLANAGSNSRQEARSTCEPIRPRPGDRGRATHGPTRRSRSIDDSASPRSGSATQAELTILVLQPNGQYARVRAKP